MNIVNEIIRKSGTLQPFNNYCNEFCCLKSPHMFAGVLFLRLLFESTLNSLLCHPVIRGVSGLRGVYAMIHFYHHKMSNVSEHITLTFTSYWYLALCAMLTCVWLFETPWTVEKFPQEKFLPGSSFHWIFQAVLEWVAIFSSRGSSRPRNPIRIACVSCIGRWIPSH